MLVAACVAKQMSCRIFMSADSFVGCVTSFLDTVSAFHLLRTKVTNCRYCDRHVSPYKKRYVPLSRQRWKRDSLMLLLHDENKTNCETVSSCHGPKVNVLTSGDVVD